MDKGNLLTVSQFAEKAGVSKQAVYSRLNKDLRAYLTTVDGKKYIDTAALDVFAKKEPPIPDATQILQSEVEHLREQLAEKDKQISRMQDTLDKLAYTNQYLLNQNNKDSSPPDSDLASKEESSDTVPPPPTQAPGEEPPEEKHGLFWRLFH